VGIEVRSSLFSTGKRFSEKKLFSKLSGELVGAEVNNEEGEGIVRGLKMTLKLKKLTIGQKHWEFYF